MCWEMTCSVGEVVLQFEEMVERCWWGVGVLRCCEDEGER